MSSRTQSVVTYSGGSTLDSETKEGSNFLYKNLALLLLLSMNRFKSTRFSKIFRLVAFAIEDFEQRLASLEEGNCLTSEELGFNGILKKKHYHYGAYLSALTSVPILSPSADNAQALCSMVAKTSAITSIKVLDNINDRFLSKQEASESQRKHLRAFTEDLFDLDYEASPRARAENSCMRMARWTFELARRGLARNSEMYRIYRRDFEDYIDGQTRSIDEKGHDSKPITSIQDYIQRINEKSVGKIWVDIDFCFLEKSHKRLAPNELNAVLCIRKAADYFFKGCNIYDDVADLEEDLRRGVFNSVPLLALDSGKIDETDLNRGKIELLRILRQCDAVNDAVHLGDLIYLQGFRPLIEAKRLSELMDADAIIFGAKILRGFAIRKWFIHERSLDSLGKTAVSFGNERMYKISEQISSYSEYA